METPSSGGDGVAIPRAGGSMRGGAAADATAHGSSELPLQLSPVLWLHLQESNVAQRGSKTAPATLPPVHQSTPLPGGEQAPSADAPPSRYA